MVERFAVGGKPHGVEPVVDVHDVPSDGRCEGGQQEGGHVAHLGGGQLLLNGCIGVRVPGGSRRVITDQSKTGESTEKCRLA